jgi:hypothetical protein
VKSAECLRSTHRSPKQSSPTTDRAKPRTLGCRCPKTPEPWSQKPRVPEPQHKIDRTPGPWNVPITLRHCISCNSASASSIPLHAGSPERLRRRPLPDALHRLSNGQVLDELLLLQCLTQCLTHCCSCNSASASSTPSHVGSPERRRRRPLPGALHRSSNGQILDELLLLQCLRHCCSCNSASASSIPLHAGSPERLRRRPLPDALHRLSNGQVLDELLLLQCLTHCCSCNSASASSKPSHAGSSGRRRRRPLPDALHRLSNGPVLDELLLLQCFRHCISCNSASASSIPSHVGSLQRRRRCPLPDAPLSESNGLVLVELQLAHGHMPCTRCNSTSTPPDALAHPV